MVRFFVAHRLHGFTQMYSSICKTLFPTRHHLLHPINLPKSRFRQLMIITVNNGFENTSLVEFHITKLNINSSCAQDNFKQ
jgi:hypothetical protein